MTRPNDRPEPDAIEPVGLERITEFFHLIAMKRPKPADLTPNESAAWDELEREMRGIASRGGIPDLPAM